MDLASKNDDAPRRGRGGSALPPSKDTCPWAEGDGGAEQLRVKVRNETPARKDTCPWSSDQEPVGEEKKPARAPAPWDSVNNSDNGFGGQKKSKPNAPTSLWQNEDDCGRFERGSYQDHTAEIANIQAANRAQKAKNAAPKNDGIF